MNLEDNELVLMCRTKDGQHRCVPVSKLKDFQESEEKRLNNYYSEKDLQNKDEYKKRLCESIVEKQYKDIKESEIYSPEMDNVVYDIIEKGHCSSARVQNILNSGYPRAMRVIDTLKEYGYISDYELGNKCLITKELFDTIVNKRI